MALSRRMAAPVLVLMLLLVATEMGTTKVAEARYRYCMSQSHRFKGLCVSSTNCGNVCHNEHFPGGECKMEGGTRKCFCKKLC